MADPQFRGVRDELQRDDGQRLIGRDDRVPPKLAAMKWLWLAFIVAVLAVIALAYGVF